MVKEMQNAYNEYINYGKELERIENDFDNDPENEALETAWNEAYEKYWNAREALVDMLMTVTKCERSTANAMIASDKFEQLMRSKVM